MADLTGTDNDDILNSTLSDDSVEGGAGQDTVKFSGKAKDYSIQGNVNGSWTVTDQNTADGDDGSDTLTNVEILEFTDQNYYINYKYAPSGNEFQVNTHTSDGQSTSSITTLNDDGFVVTWQSQNQGGEYGDIYAQRYNSDGTVNGAEFQVNTYTNYDQGYASTTALTDGGFVVT